MKKLLFVLVLFIILLIGAFQVFVVPKLDIVNGYASKKACSCYFISERELKSIKEQDLSESPLNLASLKVNLQDSSVVSSVLGIFKRKAKFKQGLGCVLINGQDDVDNEFRRPLPEVNDSLAWPFGKKASTLKTYDVDQGKLEEALDMAFDKNGEFQKKTIALLAIKDDSIILEKYAEGYNQETELLGWSMTKSITNMLVGILVKEGKLSVDQKALFPEWTDARSEITLDNLLRMNSGLDWDEIYSEVADATEMLFKSDNMPGRAIGSPAAYPPGEVFNYSSGTSNLVGLLLRNQFETVEDYHNFPYEKLFNPLGLESAIIETDEDGNFVCSSYCFATAREWATLGLLYLHKGQWGQDTIFTEDWYNYSITSTQASPDACYGAHIWLNTNHNDIQDGPEDMFKFSGYEGQYVYILPSQNMVIVRMGLSEGPPFDMNGVIKTILEACN